MKTTYLQIVNKTIIAVKKKMMTIMVHGKVKIKKNKKKAVKLKVGYFTALRFVCNFKLN